MCILFLWDLYKDMPDITASASLFIEMRLEVTAKTK